MFPSFFQILLSSFSFISHFIPFNTFSLIFTILHIHFILINIILFTFYHSKSKHSYLNHHSQQSLFNQLYQSFHFTLSFILLNYLHHHWVAVCVRDESICWSQFTIHSISISSHSTLWYDQTQSLITISFTILQISLFFSLINLSIIHHLHSFFFCCVFEMIEEMSRIQIRFVNNRLNPIEQSWIEWEYKCGNTSQSHKGRINEFTLIETMSVKRSKCLIITMNSSGYDTITMTSFIISRSIDSLRYWRKIVCCESDSFCSVHSISWFYGVIGLSAIYSSLSFINFYIHSFIIMQLWIMTMIQLNSYYILPDSESLLSISLVFSWLQNGIIFLIKCLWRIIPDRNEECGYNHLRMEIERELDGVFELKEN